MNCGSSIDIYRQSCEKQIATKKLLLTQEPSLALHEELEGWDRRGEVGSIWKGDIYIYTYVCGWFTSWLVCIVVKQKLPHYCKAIIYQLKNK